MAESDKIINRIKERSQKAAEHARTGARSKADEILAQARADIEGECVNIERRSKQVVASILERGRTVAELKKRGAILAGRRGLIGAITGMAKAELKGLETGAYIDMTLELTAKSIQTSEGELLFSGRNLERLPEGFEDRLNVALKDKGAVLHISGNIRDIDDGLILTYGGIEENCSTGTLFDAVHGILQGKV